MSLSIENIISNIVGEYSEEYARLKIIWSNITYLIDYINSSRYKITEEYRNPHVRGEEPSVPIIHSYFIDSKIALKIMMKNLEEFEDYEDEFIIEIANVQTYGWFLNNESREEKLGFIQKQLTDYFEFLGNVYIARK